MRKSLVVLLLIMYSLSEAVFSQNGKSVVVDNVAPGDILINEVLFNPYDDGEDFVELYNNTDYTIMLNSIRLATWDADLQKLKTMVALPDSVFMLPQDYVVLTIDADAIYRYYTAKHRDKVVVMKKMPAYSNQQGVVIVSLEDSTVIDRFDYTEELHYRWLTDVEGVSLERRSFEEPTNSAANWHSAAKQTGWATPTYKNSQAMNMIVSDNAFGIEPEIFSPDNDGYNDLLTITYSIHESDMLSNITIFDEQGRLVKALERNAWLGTNGSFVWDGSDENGNRCRIGNYVVYIEVYNTKGSLQTIKKVVTLMLK
ncbi:MAG: lamin tail domain-containing protein [Bacteroidales bacterium]|nr:lamin tail domain-containing protein [Bacteroidales bacterium]